MRLVGRWSLSYSMKMGDVRFRTGGLSPNCRSLLPKITLSSPTRKEWWGLLVQKMTEERKLKHVLHIVWNAWAFSLTSLMSKLEGMGLLTSLLEEIANLMSKLEEIGRLMSTLEEIGLPNSWRWT